MKPRTPLLSALFSAVLALGLNACGNDSGEIQYQAVCSQMHGIVRGWEGPRHDRRVDALKDAEAHKQAYPGHTVVIEEVH